MASTVQVQINFLCTLVLETLLKVTFPVLHTMHKVLGWGLGAFLFGWVWDILLVLCCLKCEELLPWDCQLAGEVAPFSHRLRLHISNAELSQFITCSFMLQIVITHMSKLAREPKEQQRLLWRGKNSCERMQADYLWLQVRIKHSSNYR